MSAAPSSLTNRQSVARRAPIQPPTPARSRIFAIFSLPLLKRARAAGSRGDFLSTFPVAAAKRVRATVLSPWRCISSRRSMSTCDVCEGKRFMKETLEVTYRGKNIYDVLQMTVEEAEKFFDDIPAIADRLQSLNATGLEYLTLGQSATTLSGGEAQRVKIASELYRPMPMKTHLSARRADGRFALRRCSQAHRDTGGARAAWQHGGGHRAQSRRHQERRLYRRLRPDGGTQGGKVVAKGTPEEVAAVEGSHTGDYLAKVLKRHAKK